MPTPENLTHTHLHEKAMYEALSVIAKDGQIRRFLAAHDPMALRQVEAARLCYEEAKARTSPTEQTDWRRAADRTLADLKALGEPV